MTTLLLHPIGLDRHTWATVPIDAAVAVDLPGHGESELGHVESLADVADAVLSGLPDGAGPIDVVGVSLGGMTALQLALRRPDRVRSIVVACAPAATPTDAMMQRAVDTERLGMAGVLAATLERWFTPETLAAASSEIRSVRERLLADDPAVFAAYWRFIAGHDVRHRLGELRLPVTVVAGTGDVSVPPSVARELATGIEGARYVEIEGAHMLHLESPDRFAAAVVTHLAELEFE